MWHFISVQDESQICLGLATGSNSSSATVLEAVNHTTVFFFFFFLEAVRCPGYWLGPWLTMYSLNFPISFAGRCGHIIRFRPMEVTCAPLWVLGILIFIILLENSNDWNNLGSCRLRTVDRDLLTSGLWGWNKLLLYLSHCTWKSLCYSNLACTLLIQLLTTSATRGKLFNLCKPQFPHLWNGVIIFYFVRY